MTLEINGVLTIGSHKNYFGRFEYDRDAGIFHGEVIGVRDVITFQGKTINEVKKGFVGSVDEYLEFCASRGEAPDKPYSGKFLARVSPQLHEDLARAATLKGISLNEFVRDTLMSVATGAYGGPSAHDGSIEVAIPSKEASRRQTRKHSARGHSTRRRSRRTV